jgi:hypothetical protein
MKRKFQLLLLLMLGLVALLAGCESGGRYYAPSSPFVGTWTGELQHNSAPVGFLEVEFNSQGQIVRGTWVSGGNTHTVTHGGATSTGIWLVHFSDGNSFQAQGVVINNNSVSGNGTLSLTGGGQQSVTYTLNRLPNN